MFQLLRSIGLSRQLVFNFFCIERILPIGSTKLILKFDDMILHVTSFVIIVAARCAARTSDPLGIGTTIGASLVGITTVSDHETNVARIQLASESIVIHHERIQIWQG